MEESKITNFIKKEVERRLSFQARKVGDTPTDDLQLTPRGYVNMHGNVTARPNSSVAQIGQRYFATNTNIPMTFNGTNWVDGVASVVAIN